jgi:hypothetical protein
VAGIGSLVTIPLVSGDLDGLRSLRAPVVSLIERSIGWTDLAAPAVVS